jgi:phosphonate transport system permease protein
VLIALAAFALLAVSAQRVQLGGLVEETGALVGASLGIRESSQIGRAVTQLAGGMVPIVIGERTPVSRIENFDAERLPPFGRLEEVQLEERRMNPATLALETSVRTETYLVEPLGYLMRVLGKMLETIEIGIWATLFAIGLSLPLAFFSARNYAPHWLVYGAARGVVGFLRATPELISTLFLVLAFGFGPASGILALALHGAGFLGKFYADDIEASDPRPQEALRAIGAGKLKVLRIAVIPQVLPSFTALTLYLLDRNIRMATVVGLVGGGGIGQELKGRYDLFEYDRVGTMLLVIFATVLILDQISARIRKRLI